jgi:hypothetical protein
MKSAKPLPSLCTAGYRRLPSAYITLTRKAMYCIYNVILRCVCVTIVAVEKRTLSVCLWPVLSNMQEARAVLCCHLWPF